MKGFFAAIGRFFKRIFSKDFREYIEQLTDVALPFVSAIAEATPNRADDEIVAVYQKYRKEGLYDPAKPADVLLRDLAVAILRDYAPGTAGRILILAVELAYNAYREARPEDPAPAPAPAPQA